MLEWTPATTFHEAEPPPIPWVIEGFAAVGAVTVLVGDPGIGKSYTTLTMAANVTCGLPVLGMNTKIGGVAVLDAENGRAEVHRRAVAVGLRSNAVVAVAPGGFDLAERMWELEDICTPASTRLLVLDSWRSLFPNADENSSQEVAKVLTPIQKLAQEYGVAVILLHHRSKNGGLRGSTAFQSTAEFVVHLTKDREALYLYWEKARMGKKPARKALALTEQGAVEA